MNQKLIILGAGQYGFVAKEIAEAMGCFEAIDFLDDVCPKAIDRLANYRAYVDRYSYAVVAIGDAETRLKHIQGLEAAGFRIATLISPNAYVAPSAEIKRGVIAEPMTVVNANARVGVGVILCAGAIVNHNATVGDGCVLQCGSVVAARAQMEAKCTLDYCEVLREQTKHK